MENQTQARLTGTTANGEADFAQIKTKEGAEGFLKLSALKEGQYTYVCVAQSKPYVKEFEDNAGKKVNVEKIAFTLENVEGQKTLEMDWKTEMGKTGLLHQFKDIALKRAALNLVGVKFALKVEKQPNGKNKYSVFWLNEGS